MRLFEGTPFDIPPTCDRCGKPEKDCRCPPPEARAAPPSQQTARITVEKRKRGKTVTVVRGLVGDRSLVELLSRLKTACGAGGTLKDGILEIQGEHPQRVGEVLRSHGYQTKG
jgi:translation initiation factor 1